MSIATEAVRLHDRYKRDEMSPVDVAREQPGAIDRLNRDVNAFVLIDHAVALDMACLGIRSAISPS